MGSTVEESLKPLYEGLAVTREEYLDLEYDGFKYDMIDGVLHLAPSAFDDHARAQASFTGELIILQRAIGRRFEVYTELDIFLPNGGDVLRPDICAVMTERLGIVKNHIHGTPDLVVEILSKKTRKRDLGVKADRYLACGVKEYWILDPEVKSIQVWTNRGEKWDKRKGDSLSSELLDGFQVKAADVFL